MVPYFGNEIKFGFKLRVMVTPLGYCIKFSACSNKDSTLQEYEIIGLGLSPSVVANSVSKLPVMLTSNNHNVMDSYFTRPDLLRHLSAMRVAGTRTVSANAEENDLLRYMIKINKEKRGLSDVVTDVSSKINTLER